MNITTSNIVLYQKNTVEIAISSDFMVVLLFFFFFYNFNKTCDVSPQKRYDERIVKIKQCCNQQEKILK